MASAPVLDRKSNGEAVIHSRAMFGCKKIPRSVVYVAALIMIALYSAQPALATQDGWPALYDVTGVASNDVLNIRSEPNAGTGIVGTLSHDATNIEVIAANEEYTWGLVNQGERSGWVALRFLARHPGQFDSLYPEFQSCGGTEPFWSLARSGGTLTLDVAFDDRPAVAELVEWETGTLNHRGRYSFATPSMTGVVAREYCNDGMTDREFGLEINLILRGEETHLQGCCSLKP